MPKKKEKVIIFDGEDKFIARKKSIYDIKSGEAYAIGDDAPPSDRGVNPVTEIDDGVYRGGTDSGKKRDSPDLPPLSGDIITPPPQDEIPPSLPPSDGGSGSGSGSGDTSGGGGSVGSPPPPPPPQPPVVPVLPAVPIVPTNLGSPPSSGSRAGGGGGAGGSDAKDKGKINWLLWLLLGGAALYFLTRKKK
jgi:hypothetical protein